MLQKALAKQVIAAPTAYERRQLNSIERLAAIRRWLETVPGVTFVRTRVFEASEAPAREAVRTEHGRRRVERLIGSMPDPAGMEGVTVPRARMRHGLGLDSGETEN